MTLILNASDWDELHEQAPITCPDGLVLDSFEELTGMPKILGRGYDCAMDLTPGARFNLSAFDVHQDFVVKIPVHDHPIQIGVFLSGMLYFDEVHPNLGGDRSYFSGSGISPAVAEIHRAGEHLTSVNIEIDPDVFEALVMEQSPHSELLRPLLKGEDWKESFYPIVTPAIRAIAQQMWNAPCRGELKRLYLQAKVMELLVIYLDLIADHSSQTHAPGWKPETIDRLHQAKEILTQQLAHPPSLSELAQQVGMSDRTLQRGFREVFDTTVFGYLHTLRMEQAEQLLRTRQMRVSEVAHAVGYSHLGHFTEAFKRRFGITPKQCQKGEKGTVMAWMSGMHSS